MSSRIKDDTIIVREGIGIKVCPHVAASGHGGELTKCCRDCLGSLPFVGAILWHPLPGCSVCGADELLLGIPRALRAGHPKASRREKSRGCCVPSDTRLLSLRPWNQEKEPISRRLSSGPTVRLCSTCDPVGPTRGRASKTLLRGRWRRHPRPYFSVTVCFLARNKTRSVIPHRVVGPQDVLLFGWFCYLFVFTRGTPQTCHSAWR